MAGVKLKDIAERTGVSISTVSRILSGDTNRKMKEETINSVIRAARELGWYQTKKENLRHSMPLYRVCCVVMSGKDGIIPEPFVSILDGIRSEMKEREKAMRITFSVCDTRDRDVLELLKKEQFNSVIITGVPDRDLLDRIRETVPHFMYAGLNPVSGADEVYSDAREGIKDAVDLMWRKGHRKIAFIGPTAIPQEARNESHYLGYIEGLSTRGIIYDPILVEDACLSVPDGYSGAERLFSRVRPDGIITANDSIAIGVLRFLHEKEIACPEEVMVTGFGNKDVSAFIEPSLTTFSVPIPEIGRIAVKFAIDRIEHPREHSIRVSLPYVMTERKSTEGDFV